MLCEVEMPGLRVPHINRRRSKSLILEIEPLQLEVLKRGEADEVGAARDHGRVDDRETASLLQCTPDGGIRSKSLRPSRKAIGRIFEER